MIRFIEHASSVTASKVKAFELDYDDEEGFYSCSLDILVTTKRLICVSKVIPEKWQNKPLLKNLSSVTIPYNASSLGLSLRAGHAGPNNRGSFIISWNKPRLLRIKRSIEIDEVTGATHQLFMQLETLRLKKGLAASKKLALQTALCIPFLLKNMPSSCIVKVGNVSITNMLAPALLKSSTVKILSSYGHNALNMAKVPEFVQDFFNTYVAGLNRTEGSRLWRRVKNWYQSLPDTVKLKTPKYVFRGMRTETPKLIAILNKYRPAGKVVKYIHKGRYPISASTSVKIAMDYSEFPAVGLNNASKRVANVFARKLILKLAIKPEDVVFDTRLVQKLSYHSAQSELVLDPTVKYKALVRNFDDITFKP